MLRRGSKSFALATHALPSVLRHDVKLLYAWCRYCDDEIDGQSLGQGQKMDYRQGQVMRLAELRTSTRLALEAKNMQQLETLHPVFRGLHLITQRHNISPHLVYHVLDGFTMDVEARTYDTVEDILEYSYHVAGVVGVIMAQIMGVQSTDTLERASDLGLAFQLTNIARDVVDDARAGRVFLPHSLLRQYGAPTQAQALSLPQHWPAAFAAAKTLLEIAENYYCSAVVGISALPFRAAWAISTALLVYREIGLSLNRQGVQGWHERIHTPTSRKLYLMLKAFRGPHLQPLYSREGLYKRSF